MLDYGRTLGPWREAFGERLSVHAVDLSESEGELAAHFFGLLGVPGSDGPQWRDVRENRRPGAKELEVLRRTGAALMDKGYGFRLRKRLLGRLDRVVPLLEGDAPFAPLSAARALELSEGFARVNFELATAYGIDAGGPLLREPVPRAPRPGSAQWDDFRAAERQRVRRYVLAQTGADLDRAPDGAASPARPLSAAAVGALRVARTRAGLYRARCRAAAAAQG